MLRIQRHVLLPGLLVGVLPAVSSCHDSTGPVPQRPAAVVLNVQAPGFIRTVSVEVDGPGIDAILVFNITVDSTGGGSGSLRLPAGAGRRIVVRAYDSAGVNTHRGDTTVTLFAGRNVAIAVTVFPLLGDQPVVIRLFTPRFAIVPGDTTILSGDTLDVAVMARDSLGAVIANPQVEWFSGAPAIVEFVAPGRIVGKGVGVAPVIAIWGAYGARMTLVVSVP